LQLTKLSPVLAGLIVAACHAAPGLAPPPIAAPQAWERHGIDLATDTSDVMNELHAGQVDFVARYYRDPDSHLPPLSMAEAQRLSSLGLKIVAVWEWHRPEPSHFQNYWGYYDAMMAAGQAKAIGQPPGTAIYFAVDRNVPGDQLAMVTDYFRGIAAGLAAAGGGRADYKIGVYGSGSVCDAVKGSGLAQYSWLSSALAWEGSADYADWDIMQGARLSELSFDQDSDEARGDYGGFTLAATGTPGPDIATAASVGPGPLVVAMPASDARPILIAR
jgi:hypothetical protein